ncbi:unnamed protein product [Leuciscus chuanchicus]
MLPHSLMAQTLLLLLTAQILSTGDCGKVPQKQRHKREWVVPVKNIMGNVDYSNEPYISRVETPYNTANLSTRCTSKAPLPDVAWFSSETGRIDPYFTAELLWIHRDTGLTAVDYEDVKDLNLGIGVVNKAPFHPSVSGAQSGMNVNFGGSGAGAGGGGGGGGGGGRGSSGGGGSSSWSSSSSGGNLHNVKINVKNQPEGPKFLPRTKAIPISEGKTFDSKEIIARYPAIDTDTGKEATNVKYIKASDPDNWLSIDETTGAIRMNKAPDRESKYLVNGTYYGTIYCVTQGNATPCLVYSVADLYKLRPVITPLLLHSVIPLMLMLCKCGAAGMAGGFTDMPYDTKEHLISYHTEGQGEDRDVPVPDNIDGLMIGFGSKVVGGMQISGGRGTAGGYLDSNSISGGRDYSGYNGMGMGMGMGYMDSIRRN